MTIEASKLDEFRRRLSPCYRSFPPRTLKTSRRSSATVDLSELNIETIEQISRLEPFGQGDEVPLLAAEGVTMCDRAVVGETGEHMRFVATDGAASVPAIMFRVPQIDKLINCDSAVDLVFEAVAEALAGRVKPKLMIKDVLVRDTTLPSVDDRGSTSFVVACSRRIPACAWSRVSARRSPSFPIRADALAYS